MIKLSLKINYISNKCISAQFKRQPRDGLRRDQPPRPPLGRLPVRQVWAGVQDGAGADPAPVLLTPLPLPCLQGEVRGAPPPPTPTVFARL